MNKLFSVPTPLTPEHKFDTFASGEMTLDSWLQERALSNMKIGASRTYVLCPQNSLTVIAYYALCMGQILNKETTAAMRRNMPEQIPAVILARLAVDQQWQGQGLGSALLKDAVNRTQQAAKEIACRLMIVHALSVEAENFYQRYGFVRLPSTDKTTYALDLLKYGEVSLRISNGNL
jgi:GNAT superfamily N-acetyltransferase